MSKTILILGACGGVGKPVSRRLLKTANVAIIIAGRNINESNDFCSQLRKEFPGKNISAIFADASNYESLISAFSNISLVIDATTAVSSVQNVAKAALKAGCDYLDLHFDQKTVADLEALRRPIENSGHCFITQAGFHPGLPAAFVRYAALQFDELEKAIIGLAMSAKIEKPESAYEIVDALSDYHVDIYTNGKWRKTSFVNSKRIDFGRRFGLRTCYPLQMVEMRALPQMFHFLRETGVYVSGFNWFVDYFVLPLAFVFPMIKKGLGRHAIAKLLIFGLRTFSKDIFGVSFVLEAEGIKDGAKKQFRIIAEHDDGYEFTAIPVVAFIHQYLAGTVNKAGLFMMGHVVDPMDLLIDMEKMGITIKYQISNDPIYAHR